MNDTVTGDGGNVNVGWSWNEPAFYWCIGRPGVDKWSRYFDFTIEDSNQIGGAQTQAFDFANQQGFTYDNKTVGIAFYVQVSWWLVPPGPPLGNVCGGAYSCDWFENTGNWSDNYVYSS